MDSVAYMTCELKVDTKSSGWHTTINKVLKSIKGVSYTIDAETGIARVSGKINSIKLLKKLAKAGKHAQLIRVYSGYDQYNYNYNNLFHGNNNPIYNYNDCDYYTGMNHYHHHHPHHSYYEQPTHGISQLPPPPPMNIHHSYTPDVQCTIM